MALYVKCDCGYEVTAQSEDEFVGAVQKHGREVHSMDVSRDQALAMAKTV